jgi:GT2 family glycosyltransferase
MTLPTLGVVIVTFNAADVILDCLESLLGSSGLRLSVVVVDNASSDATVAVLRDWASGRVGYVASDDLPIDVLPCSKPVRLRGETDESDDKGHSLTLIEAGLNGGFAAGVNLGLNFLATRPEIDRFWVLNPDSVIPPGTAAAFATEPGPEEGFSLMGGRVLYLETPDVIQIDGGKLDRRSGVTHNVHLFASHGATPPPDPAGFDFIMGASMVASRAFLDAAGPLSEDYFLYYEEVDWAQRRGRLPLAYCKSGIIFHRAGTAIGSPTKDRLASPFSLYFKHRGRMRFVRRHFPRNLPMAYVWSIAKAGQLLLKGLPFEAWTVLVGSFDGPPPASVRNKLSPEAAARAFGRAGSGS